MTTQDITVWDEAGELAVTIKTDSKGDNRFYVDARVQGSGQGVSGDDASFHDEQTYNVGETKDLWNYLVPVGRVVFVHSFTGSSSKTGASRSHFSIVNRVGDVIAAEIEVGGFYADAAFTAGYPKALQFAAGDRVIFKITNNGGNNNIVEMTSSAVEDNA